MIENCHQDNIIEMNFNKAPCCLKHLLIKNRMSEEYLLTYEFGKYLLKSLKNIFEKEKTIIKNNSNINDNISKEFFCMTSKYISQYYITNNIKYAKYLCKIVFNFFNRLEFNNNKIKEINSIKNNLCCIYHKEKKYEKALSIIMEFYNSNNIINSNDNLIYLNNCINLCIKSKNRITKDILKKINLLKTMIIQRINQISQLPKLYDSSIINNNKEKNVYNLSEIQLFLFIFYNFCNINFRCNNNRSQALSYYKRGYELSMYYLGENHHLSLKYKKVINNSLFNKINLKNSYKYLDNNENRKTPLSKFEINSKLDEINVRLEKIGKSISPVRKILSNYYNEEKKISKYKTSNLFKNKSKIELYAKDIVKEDDYSNSVNFDNKMLRNSVNNTDDSEKPFKINVNNLPKFVINLNNENNDNLVCTTLYQKAEGYENEEENTNDNNYKINMPKISVNLNDENNDTLVCTTLYQKAEDFEDENEKENNNYKINVPKISVSLNNENNDTLVCTTLYQEATENNNNSELQEKKGFSLPKINLCLDQTNNDDYTCETFFLSADEPQKDESENTDNQNKKIQFFVEDTKKNESNTNESINKNKQQFKFSVNIIKNDDTNYNNIPNVEPENENEYEHENSQPGNKPNKINNEDLLKKYFIDIKFYRPLEIKTNQKEEVFDISKFLVDIKNKNTDSINTNDYIYDYKMRILGEKKYLIKLEIINNDSVKIFLIDKNNNNNELLSSKYSFNKLLNLFKIIRHDLCLNNMETYYNYKSYNDYITKTFLNFITVNNEKESYKFKMAKKPLGLCHCNIVIQLHFCKCVFDILAISKNYCKIILSSENDDFNSMGIDTYFDDESFNMLIDSELIDNKYSIYSFKNNDLNNNETLLELIKQLQKCLNSYCSGVVNVFDDIYPKTNPNQKKLKELLIFKLDISNKINNVKLYVCEFGNRLCKVVTVDQNLVKLKGIIYSCEINDLFGYETSDIWAKLFSYQKVIFGQLMLNSCYFNESNSRICINKYEKIDEFNFVQEMQVCNLCLIKLNEKLQYIKFTLYLSIGTWEYTKIIFINSNKNNNNIKLKNLKDKFINELNQALQSINKGEVSLFGFLNID